MFGLLVFAGILAFLDASCPKDSKNIGGICYIVNSAKTKFEDAKKICKFHGGQLIPLKNSHIFTKLTEHVQPSFPDSTHFWVQHDQEHDRYNDEEEEFPHKHKEACISIEIGLGEYKLQNCFMELPFVCEFYVRGHRASGEEEISPKRHLLPTTCPTGWIYYNEKCYKLYAGAENRKTFDDAEDKCKMFSGHLASILDQAENNFIQRRIYPPFGGAWIGLKRVFGDWIWTDGSTLDYTNIEKLPSCANLPTCPENGVKILQASGRWDTKPLDAQLPFICKMNATLPLHRFHHHK